MSKGSNRRPAAISAVEAERNWARTFGKADSERCKGAPSDQNAETIPRVLDGGRGPQKGVYVKEVVVPDYLGYWYPGPISPTEGA